uniref:WAP four-disulfide core domain protein 1 n=1 Tax=Geotrypetes seraphini TaxID=260995 RepID=A0A6P8QS44_GEOSA|nr:WAP four-disulfide core domain protein 1 isoform X2 [Geotrypetes seraphini]
MAGGSSWTLQEHRGRKPLVTACCILLLLTRGSARAPGKRALETKRTDKDDDYEYPLHSQKSDRCPPPPQLLPERACEVPRCRTDSECGRYKRCCYNGCIYACLEPVQPPAAEACSTTEDGDEPLQCPTGYECHIINPGNPAEGIPNRGHCIKRRRNSDGPNLRHKYHKEYFENNFNNMVSLEKQKQKHLG